MNWRTRFQQANGRAWWTVYREYLASNEWQERRNAVLLRDGCCVICSKPFELEVHHRSYEMVGKELLTDLTTLCKPCHESVTRMLRRRRQASRDKNLIERVVSIVLGD